MIDNDKDVIAWCKNLKKVYGEGDNEVRALDGISVELQRNNLTAIMGPSGSGKSTFMHCMAGLDTATSGTIMIDSDVISEMNQSELTKLRRNNLGFIFQSFNLIQSLNAIENIMLPINIAKRKVDKEWFDEIIGVLKLGDRLKHKPTELSGGQQQRVAIARSMISKPKIIFADEPTGNLDSTTSTEVMDLLCKSVDEMNQSIVIVTHDPNAAKYADRALILTDGKISADINSPSPADIIANLEDK
jgi:putative ABC transport system ATP-binding protein